MLKKRHVAETRAARSAKRHGFTPADVKAALERLSGRLNTHTVPNADLAPEDASPASSSRDFKTTATTNAWRPPNGGVCGAKEARTIAALARCFPGLRVTAVPSRSNKNRVEVVVDLVDSESPEPAGVAGVAGFKKRTTRSWRATPRAPPRSRAGAHSRGVPERPDAPREAGESLGRSAAGTAPDRRRAPPTTRAGRRGAGAYNAPKDDSSRGGRRDATATRRDATISTTPHPFASGGTLQEQDGFFEYADADVTANGLGFRTRFPNRFPNKAMKVLSATSRDTRPVSAGARWRARGLCRARAREGRAGHSRARAGARQAEKAGAGAGGETAGA